LSGSLLLARATIVTPLVPIHAGSPGASQLCPKMLALAFVLRLPR
jgi:hypothetical protein